MRARTGKIFFDNDDLNINAQQNNYNSPNMASNINPLPLYDLGKQSYPAYSFTKDERF